MEFIKKNMKWIVIVALIVYTVLVVFISITIYKSYLANKIENAFSDVLSGIGQNNDSANKTRENNNNKETINLKQTITSDKWEVTLNEVEYLSEVRTPVERQLTIYSMMDTTHYKVSDENSIFLVCKFDIKNIATTSLTAKDSIEAKAFYDGKYEYTGFMVTLNSSKDAFESYESVSPLTSAIGYYIIEMPKNITEDGKSMAVQLTIGDKIYEYKVQ